MLAGKGDMAAIYRAHQTEIGEPVTGAAFLLGCLRAIQEETGVWIHMLSEDSPALSLSL